MKPCTSATAAAIAVLAVALTATACDGQSGDAADKPSASSGGWDKPRLPTYEVAKDVKIDSPILRKAQRAGKLVIGAKNDQPYLGFQDANGKRSGFDIEIAKMVAADLGFSPEMIEFKTVDTKNREAAISNGEVDLYIGTYTINDERKKRVGFAARTTRRAPTFWSARTTGRSVGRFLCRARRSARSRALPRSGRSRSPTTTPRPSRRPSTTSASRN